MLTARIHWFACVTQNKPLFSRRCIVAGLKNEIVSKRPKRFARTLIKVLWYWLSLSCQAQGINRQSSRR